MISLLTDNIYQYMNYERYSQDPGNSPLLNGNASSLGGNGAPEPTYKGVRQQGRTPNIIASGGGGGCVTEGPFSEFVTPSSCYLNFQVSYPPTNIS